MVENDLAWGLVLVYILESAFLSHSCILVIIFSSIEDQNVFVSYACQLFTSENSFNIIQQEIHYTIYPSFTFTGTKKKGKSVIGRFKLLMPFGLCS